MFNTEMERAKAAIERLIRQLLGQRMIVATAFLSIAVGVGAAATPYFVDAAGYVRKIWKLKLTAEMARIESALQLAVNINYEKSSNDDVFYSESRASITQTARVNPSTCVLNVTMRVNIVYRSKLITSVEFKERNNAAYNESISIKLSDVEQINIYDINDPRGIYYDQARTEWTADTGSVHVSSGSGESIITTIDGKVLQEEWAKENPYFSNGWTATFYARMPHGNGGLSKDLSSVARYCGAAKLA
jgi:hypothetical protein